MGMSWVQCSVSEPKRMPAARVSREALCASHQQAAAPSSPRTSCSESTVGGTHLPFYQWLSLRGNFVPQGTFGSVEKMVSVATTESATGISWVEARNTGLETKGAPVIKSHLGQSVTCAYGGSGRTPSSFLRD